MKNNKSILSGADAQSLLRNLGEPGLVAGRIDSLEEEGNASIVELIPSIPEHRQVYEEIHNNPDKYEVVHESDFGGRGKCHVLVRFVRKGPWDVTLPSSFEASQKKSTKSRKRDKGKSIGGFAESLKKGTKKKTPKKKKAPKRPRKKSPKKKATR